jgi:hypothetical protein
MRAFCDGLNGEDKSLLSFRLRGNNRYCLKPEYGDIKEYGRLFYKQAIQDKRDNVRYYALNFCYQLHRTLECRVFPMFSSPEIACKAIGAHVTAVNEYLATVPAVVFEDQEYSASVQILDRRVSICV